ncbi:MAG: TA system VapC family ribonuclease toxin [Caulobacteraceae bacterium]
MTFLLDVNVMIALIDRAHVHHELSRGWFEREGRQSWATCPISENGALRIVGHPAYGNFPGSPAAVATVLQELRTLGNHRFWPDDISLVASEFVDPARLLTSGQVTDTYLLALAISKGGARATLDRRLITAAAQGGAAGLCLVG